MKKKQKHITPKDLLQSTKIDSDKLRNYSGFENINEEEANHIIEELEKLATLLYNQVIFEQNERFKSI